MADLSDNVLKLSAVIQMPSVSIPIEKNLISGALWEILLTIILAGMK